MIIIFYTSLAYSKHCALDRYSFEPKIILFAHATCFHTKLTEFYWTHVSSSRKTDRILTESLLAPSCPLYRMISSLLNALEGKRFYFREISINVKKLPALLLLHVFIRFFLHCTLLLGVYFLIPYYFLDHGDYNCLTVRLNSWLSKVKNWKRRLIGD